jgi:hypothetical protein
MVRAALAVGAMSWLPPARAADAISFGLTPVFLDSDIELLAMLERYLTARLKRPVQLVKRRTYQEISAMLLSGQLDAAWICDDPYVQYQDQLALLGVPLYHGIAALPDLCGRQYRDLRAKLRRYPRHDPRVFRPRQHLGLPHYPLPAGAAENYPRRIFPEVLLHVLYRGDEAISRG